MAEIRKRVLLAKRLFNIADHLASHNSLPEETTWNDVRKIAKSLMRAVTQAERQQEADAKRALVERDVMRSEMHGELVDREANAARVAERQRFLYERPLAQNGLAQAFERASASASFVEAALVALCPHAHPPSRGCEVVAKGC